jgi:hypothetical protein
MLNEKSNPTNPTNPSTPTTPENPVTKCVSKCKKKGGLEFWDANEAREIKEWQIKILVNAVKYNSRFLYPLSNDAEALNQEFLHKVLCGLFVKNVVYENEHKTICIAPFLLFQFMSYGEDALIECLRKEL